METAANGQNGGFTHRIKRIWNGPEEEGEASHMQTSRPEAGSFDAQKNDTYGHGETGNRAFHPDYPKRVVPEGMNDLGGSTAGSTVISKGTVVSGNIKSDGDIEMYGIMAGSIETAGKVKVNGKQTGDVQGSGVVLTDCAVRGNVSASDTIVVDSGSVVIGDIKCGDLSFDGRIKGNVHVMGNVNCKGNAIVIGDITSTTITVESGARLQGSVQVSDGSIEDVDLPEDSTAAAPKE